MNNYFQISLVKEPAVSIFILCSYLLQVQTISILDDAIKDLEQIQFSSEIDTFLYTADLNYPNHCNISVMKCFQLEMEVVAFESKFGDSQFHDNVSRVVRIIKHFLSQEKNTETPNCQRCETFKEKKYSEFIAGFKSVIQRVYGESSKK